MIMQLVAKSFQHLYVFYSIFCSLAFFNLSFVFSFVYLKHLAINAGILEIVQKTTSNQL